MHLIIQCSFKHLKKIVEGAYFTKYSNFIINENQSKSHAGFIHYKALQYNVVALNSRLPIKAKATD